MKHSLPEGFDGVKNVDVLTLAVCHRLKNGFIAKTKLHNGSIRVFYMRATWIVGRIYRLFTGSGRDIYKSVTEIKTR